MVYQCLIQKCFDLVLEVMPILSTGIASMQLPNGHTVCVHSRFQLPLNLHETFISFLNINSKAASDIDIRSVCLIIWDEASVANAYALMCVGIMNNNVLLGGKIIFPGGDFWKVLPLIPYASRQSTVQNCTNISLFWSDF